MMVLFPCCLKWAEQEICHQFCREAARTVLKSLCKEQSQFAHSSGNLSFRTTLTHVFPGLLTHIFHLSALPEQILPQLKKISDISLAFQQLMKS